MQNRRDRLVKYLQEADLNPVLPGGGYFIVADISKLGLYTTLSSLFNEHVFVFISNIYKLHICYSMHHFYKQKEVFLWVSETCIADSNINKDESAREAFDIKFVKWAIVEKVSKILNSWKKKEYLLTNIRKMPKIKQLIKSFFRDLKNLDFEMFRSDVLIISYNC